MRKLAVVLFGLAACGGSDAKPDAPVVKIIDAAIDARPDSPPMPDAKTYDFTCYQHALPTTASDPITLSGITGSAGTSGNLSPLAGITVKVFKTGNATALDTKVSDTAGAFTTANIATGGTPLTGYIQAADIPTTGAPTYRTTFLYTPTPVAASLNNVPVPMISMSTFDQLNNSGFITPPHSDTNNGVILVLVTDCSNNPITEGVTVSAKQGTTDVTTQLFDLGLLAAQAAGTYLLFNVPADVPTTIGADYNGMTLLSHDVMAYKNGDPSVSIGSITATTVRPGPLN